MVTYAALPTVSSPIVSHTKKMIILEDCIIGPSADRDMIPASNPHRDDIVARIFEDLFNGSLEREEIPGRVKVYIAELNKLYPTQYRKLATAG